MDEYFKATIQIGFIVATCFFFEPQMKIPKMQERDVPNHPVAKPMLSPQRNLRRVTKG